MGNFKSIIYNGHKLVYYSTDIETVAIAVLYNIYCKFTDHN